MTVNLFLSILLPLGAVCILFLALAGIFFGPLMESRGTSTKTQDTSDQTPVKRWGRGRVLQYTAFLLVLIATIILVGYFWQTVSETTVWSWSQAQSVLGPPFILLGEAWPSWHLWFVFVLGWVLLFTGGAWEDMNEHGPTFARVIGVLLILGVPMHVYFGFFEGAHRAIERAESCASTGDCGPGEADIPTYTSRTIVRINPGQQKIFYADGKIAIYHGADCHRPDVQPPGVFRITASEDGITNYIESYSGEVERASVSIVRSAQSKACQRYWADRK